MRGHLGTELQNKCDFTIQVKNDKESGDFTVSSRESRFKPFPSFVFQRGDYKGGMPMIEGKYADGTTEFDEVDKQVIEETRIERAELLLVNPVETKPDPIQIARGQKIEF